MSKEVCLVLRQANVFPRILFLQQAEVDDLIHIESFVVQFKGQEMRVEMRTKELHC